MNFDGIVTINAPLEKVWAGVTNPELVSQCAPGLQSMQIIVPDKQFKVVASVGFGAVKMTFDANVEWVEKEEPTYAKVTAHGKAPGNAVDVASDMRLAALSAQSTELKWTANVVIVGAVAGLASRMMSGMTKKMAGEFFNCIKSKIEVTEIAV